MVSPFSQLSIRCQAIARAGDLPELQLGEDLRCRAGLGPNAKEVLESRMWERAGMGRLRLTTIGDGDGTRITNIGFFPEPTVPLPVVQSEVVVLRGRPFVVIFDAHPREESQFQYQQMEPADFLGRVQRLFPELSPVPERPEWTSGYISPAAIWSRPTHPRSLAAAAGAEALLLSWLEDLVAQQYMEGERAKEGVRNLDWMEKFALHFREHEPSRPYLQKVFGADWADHYINEFLFPTLMIPNNS
jgi:hypothetical protein